MNYDQPMSTDDEKNYRKWIKVQLGHALMLMETALEAYDAGVPQVLHVVRLDKLGAFTLHFLAGKHHYQVACYSNKNRKLTLDELQHSDWGLWIGMGLKHVYRMDSSCRACSVAELKLLAARLERSL